MSHTKKVQSQFLLQHKRQAVEKINKNKGLTEIIIFKNQKWGIESSDDK
jgi:hypothetical protein